MHIVIHLSQSIQIPPTIEDPTAYDEIHGALKEHNLLWTGESITPNILYHRLTRSCV